MKWFRLLDHTADLGVEVRAKSLKTLFRRMAIVLCSIIYDRERVIERERVVVELHENDREDLLIRFLQEIIFLASAKRFLVRNVRIEGFSEDSMKVVFIGEDFHPSRHRFRKEVKAATYHNLCIREEGEFMVARVIFDV